MASLIEKVRLICRLDAESSNRNPKARVYVAHERIEGATKGLRVSKSRRPIGRGV